MAGFWDVFAATAARAGARPAIEVPRAGGVQRVSYAELAARAETVARGLAAAGAGAGDRCAILADNDAAWCAAYLGILRLGGVAVPLDAGGTADQAAAALRDASARVLLAGPRAWRTAAAAASAAGGVRLAPVSDPLEPAAAPPLGPSPASGCDPAAILYTSGATGEPKGVVLTHDNLEAARVGLGQVLHAGEQDRVLGVLPLGHALGHTATLLLPLAIGARAVLLETASVAEILRTLREREITIVVGAPPLLSLIHRHVRAVAEHGGPAGRARFAARLALARRARRAGINPGPLLFRRAHRALGPRLRLLVTGGSRLDPTVRDGLYAMGFTLAHVYGLTETAGVAAIARPGEADVDSACRPLPGVEIRVMPLEGGEAGVEGEIAIRGPVVMQGYHNRPDATADALRGGWLFTGDLGRLDRAGRLHVSGRRSAVIELGSGARVQAEEVEAHYRRSPFVREVCVWGVGAAGRAAEQLHATVVPDQEALRARRVVNVGDLLRFEIEGLTAALAPSCRVPRYDIWMEPLPRTAAGALRRHAIRRQHEERARAACEAAGRPPGAEEAAWLADPAVAEAVAMVAAHASGGAQPRPDANLELDLGLDSVRRVELVAALESRFGTRLDPERAMEIFTVRQLVDALRSVADPAPPPGRRGDPWAALLAEPLPPADPVVARLLAPRPLAAAAAFVLVRALRALLARVQVEGREHLPARGAFLLCPNHQSYLDPIVLCGVLPGNVLRRVFFVGAAEYFETPLRRRAARWINLVPVDPDSQLVPAMRAAAFGLSHGKVLVLFPEGERSIDGTVRGFKKGAAILARRLHLPVVPVALSGVYEIWPRGRPPDLRTLLPWRRRLVRVTFGPPLALDGAGSDDEAAARLRDVVAAMWGAQQRAAAPSRPAA